MLSGLVLLLGGAVFGNGSESVVISRNIACRDVFSRCGFRTLLDREGYFELAAGENCNSPRHVTVELEEVNWHDDDPDGAAG